MIRVNTYYSINQIIQDTTMNTDLSGVRDTIVRQVIELQESGVREALIKLGWTPPKGE